MKCPVCKINLGRTQYDGVNIRECEQCGGQLVRKSAVDNIKRRREQTEVELLERVVNAAEDNLDTLTCRECLNKFEKKKN